MFSPSFNALLSVALNDLRATDSAIHLLDRPGPPKLHARQATIDTGGSHAAMDELVARVIQRDGPVIEDDPSGTASQHDLEGDMRDPWTIGSRLGLPLRDTLGEMVGVLSVAAATSASWNNIELERARMLALVGGGLLDATQQLTRLERRIERERVARLTRARLLEIASQTASAERPTDILRALVDGLDTLIDAELIVGALRVDDDVRFVHGDGVPEGVASRWRTAPVHTPVPVCRAIRDGEVIELADRNGITQWPLLEAEAEEANLGGFASYPIFDGSGQAIAAIGIGTSGSYGLLHGRRAVLDELIESTGQALERALAAQHATSVARNLQKSLLPPKIPRIEWLDLATLYRPAERANRVGGDWYDVVVSGPDSVDLVVGDVAGHDIASAAAMGQVRHVLASFLHAGEDPAAALESTDRYFTASRTALMATVLVVRLHRPSSGSSTTEICSAGHPAPLLVRPDASTEFVDLRSGPPIGTGFGGYESIIRPVDTDTLIAAFTDGVFERRGGDVDADLELLQATVSPAGATPTSLVRLLGIAASTTDVDDDAAAIVAGFRAPA